jgi:hypothetical protein
VRLDSKLLGTLGDQLDHILIAQWAPDGSLSEAPDVDVGLDSVDALAHHEPLVDGRPEPFDPAGEVALEVACVRPRSQTLAVDDAK